MSNWYLINNGQQVSPMSKEQMLAYGLAPNTMVWKEGMPQWTQAFNVPELMDVLHSNPVPPTAPAQHTSGKDKTAAGVLAILLGFLGIHYFYIGKVAAGFISILLSMFTCGIWPLLMFAQGIFMLTMTQEAFDEKYVYSNSTLPLF